MKANLSLLFISIFITLLIFESGIRLFSPAKKNHKTAEYTFKNFQYLSAGKNINRVLKGENGQIIDRYKINYDQFKRRQTPVKAESGRAHLFFGCSFVFGFGLDDEKTLPWLVSEKSGLQTYNYAHGGNGPNDMLALLNGHDLKKQIPGNIQKVDASFHSYSFHTGRYLGTFHKMGGARVNGPYFKINDDGLEYMGSFSKGRPVKTFLYWALYHSRLVRSIYTTSKETLYGKDSQMTLCQIVNQSYFKLKQQLGEKFGKFYFSISPLQRKFQDPYIIDYYKGIKSCLNPEIVVLDFKDARDEYDRNLEKFQIIPMDDFHPSHFANQWYANLFLKAMEN